MQQPLVAVCVGILYMSGQCSVSNDFSCITDEESHGQEICCHIEKSVGIFSDMCYDGSLLRSIQQRFVVDDDD